MSQARRLGFLYRTPSGPSLPPNLGTVQWVVAAALRLPWATVVALVCAWSAVVVSLWAAILDGLGSVVVLFVGGGAIGATGSIISFSSHTAGGLTFLAIFVAFGLGVAAGFVDAYTASVNNAIPAVAAALLVGAIIALLLGFVLTNMESRLLAWRGYRRPSQREWDGHLLPAMQEVVDAMKLPCSPRVLIADSPVPNAWAHSRHIVVTTGLIHGLDQAELTAVIAHEVMHWRQGDPLALRLVWCFGWPVVVMYAAGMWISGGGPQMQGGGGGGAAASSAPHSDAGSTIRGTESVVAVVGWFFLWPSWLLIRFVMIPAIAAESRRIEYEADAGAAAAGFGPTLHRALERLAPFEGGRSAWEAALSATHPPMELRLEALDHHEYSPPQPAKMPGGEEVLVGIGILWVLLVLTLWPLILPEIHKLLRL